MNKIKNLIAILTNKQTYVNLKSAVWQIVSFTVVLTVTFHYEILINALSWKHIPFPISNFFMPLLGRGFVFVEKFFDPHIENSIGRRELIRLAMRNMMTKKTRTFITIGGMALGIGAIVFLVSIGYGLQDMVINRVARLEEMRQADVSVSPGSKVRINDKILADTKNREKVAEVLPLIAVVGRINYQSSVTDVAVYGVTTEYLKQSAVKPARGKIFDNNDVVLTQFPVEAEVAGVSTQREDLQEAEFSIDPDQWVRVRQEPSVTGKILGYTKRREGRQAGRIVIGSKYLITDEKFSDEWVESNFDLWEQKVCDTKSVDCFDGKFVLLRDADQTQTQKLGYAAQVNLTVTTTFKSTGQVLGISNDDLVLAAASESADSDWIEIASEAGLIKPPETKKVDLGVKATKQAVVNRALIKVLNLNELDAIGKEFELSFVVTSDLLTDAKEKVESNPAKYTIVGITPDEKSPMLYVPFIDLRTLGISNYSQMKLIVDNKDNLAKVRRELETLGLVTRSVSDTVAQINSLFGTLRTVLALLGMVALAVASLGMFNTLTVSLLERTREVGLMKAMGMRSDEIRELFLTESVIMGVLGGIGGITAGIVAGKLLAVVLSAIAITKGLGIIDITSLPLIFVSTIIFLSLLVGIVTGLYPAHRATKISALNALRYE